jgi:hypothetical protein
MIGIALTPSSGRPWRAWIAQGPTACEKTAYEGRLPGSILLVNPFAPAQLIAAVAQLPNAGQAIA